MAAKEVDVIKGLDQAMVGEEARRAEEQEEEEVVEEFLRRY